VVRVSPELIIGHIPCCKVFVIGTNTYGCLGAPEATVPIASTPTPISMRCDVLFPYVMHGSADTYDFAHDAGPLEAQPFSRSLVMGSYLLSCVYLRDHPMNRLVTGVTVVGCREATHSLFLTTNGRGNIDVLANSILC
jgi:hypothetical protein